MKNNGKKLLAGLGIGLTLAGGSMMMTGCTNVNLSDAQVDKLLSVVDNADVFMNNMTETSKTMVWADEKERVYDMLRTGFYNMATCGDVLDNLRVTFDMPGDVDENWAYFGNNWTMNFYKKADGKRVYYLNTDADSVNGSFAVIENDEFSCVRVDGDNASKKFVDGVFRSCASDGLSMISLNLYVFADLEINDFVDFKKLDNGNYFVKIYRYVEDSVMVFCDIELKDNGQFVLVRFGDIESSAEFIAKYEYGVITETEVNKVIEKVNALPEADNN